MREINMNRHRIDLGVNSSYEFDVKNISRNMNIDRIIESTNSTENDVVGYLDYDLETGCYTDDYANDCFVEVKNAMKMINIIDFSFAGRMSGWFCLLSNDGSDDDDTYFEDYLTDGGMECSDVNLLRIKHDYQEDCVTMKIIVDKYIRGYCKHIEDCIIDDINNQYVTDSEYEESRRDN